jgi:Spy/CpxP family protein refolding chaperone
MPQRGACGQEEAVKSKIAKITAFGVLALALVAGIALAQTPEGGKPMHRGMHGGMMGMGMEMGFLHQLNLTPDQHAQIKQIFAAEKPNMKPLMKQEFQSRQQMMQLITSGPFDQAKVTALASQEAQVHMQMEVEHAKIASQIYGLLDSNQKAQVADIMARHQQRMQEHMQSQAPPADQQQ